MYKELLTLHYNTYKAAALNSKVKETSRNPDLDPAIYGKYVKFQSAFKVRLQYLKEGHFVTPEKENEDKCMPPLLFHYDTKIRAGAEQPDANYRKNLSCAFDEKRIQEYETENNNFSTNMQSPTAFVSLRELIIMDIAYLHLRNVKWAEKQAAHLTGDAARSSDDEAHPPSTQPDGPQQLSQAEAPPRDVADIDFTKWDPTELNSVPWLELKTSMTGSAAMKKEDSPPYMIPAILLASQALAATPEDLPDGLKTYYDVCRQRIELFYGQDLESLLGIAENGAVNNNWKTDSRSRQYTDAELEFITLLQEIRMTAVQKEVIKNLANMHAATAARGLAEEGVSTAGGSNDAEKEGREVRPRHAKEVATATAAASKGGSQAAKAPALPSKPAPPPAGRGKGLRAKAQAAVKPRYLGTESAPALSAASPAVKTVTKRRRSHSSSAVVSETTGRILLGQVGLNKMFPKTYAARKPVKDRPVEMTLSQAWHVVRRIAAQFLLLPYYYIILPYYYRITTILLYHCFNLLLIASSLLHFISRLLQYYFVIVSIYYLLLHHYYILFLDFCTVTSSNGCFVLQAMLSLKGYDIPVGRTASEKLTREEVFNLIAPYFLSSEDMETIGEADPEEMALWLETFTNTQKGLLYTSLNVATKSFCIDNYFPCKGSVPTPEHAAELGLPSGKSILSR